MFNVFKKRDIINSKERFDFIINEIEKSVSVTIKNATDNLRFLNNKVEELNNPEFVKEIISQILTQKIGFAILSLNIGIRKQENFRSLIYDTLDVWEQNIQSNSIKMSSFLSGDKQSEIFSRFLHLNTDFQYNYDNVIKYFESCFKSEVEWYTEYNNFIASDKFKNLTKNEYLSTFSKFERQFSKFTHVQ